MKLCPDDQENDTVPGHEELIATCHNTRRIIISTKEREQVCKETAAKQKHCWEDSRTKNSGSAQQDPASKDSVDNRTIHTHTHFHALRCVCQLINFSSKKVSGAGVEWASAVACVNLNLLSLLSDFLNNHRQISRIAMVGCASFVPIFIFHLVINSCIFFVLMIECNTVKFIVWICSIIRPGIRFRGHFLFLFKKLFQV